MLTIFFALQLLLADEFSIEALWSSPTNLGKINPGDSVVFSNNEKITFGNRIDQNRGGAAYIYEIPDNKVIRIPRVQLPFGMSAGYLIAHHQLAKSSRLLLPKIFDGESFPQEYIVVEHIPVQFTLSDFNFGNYKSTFSHSELISKLMNFAASTAEFSNIPDFKPLNIIFDGVQWRLIDFDPDPQIARKYIDKTVFDRPDFLEMDPLLLRELVNTARHTRTKIKFPLQSNPPGIPHSKMCAKNSCQVDLKEFLEEVKGKPTFLKVSIFQKYYPKLIRLAVENPKILRIQDVFKAIDYFSPDNPYMTVYYKQVDEHLDHATLFREIIEFASKRDLINGSCLEIAHKFKL